MLVKPHLKRINREWTIINGVAIIANLDDTNRALYKQAIQWCDVVNLQIKWNACQQMKAFS